MRLIQLLSLPLGVLLLIDLSASAGEQPVQPLLLFMQPGDAHEPVGKLTFEANPLKLRGRILPIGSAVSASQPAEGAPGKHHRRPGLHFRALLAVPQTDGAYLVFGNDTEDAGTEPRTFRWRLYHVRTTDGYHYTDLKEVYRNPQGPWLIETSMVRQESTGRMFFYPWSRSEPAEKGHALWGFVSDDGEQWRPLSDRPIYFEHDAFGMMWDVRTNRFLTGQVTHQAWKKPYPDNMGNETRRVLSMRTSQDGVKWETIGNAEHDGLITPDDQDTPDVEFYRLQPFAYGDRYLAMADLYAASPLTPKKHGPHLTCEWWVSADGIHWQRPWRSVSAQGDTPYPVKMTPMWLGREMLFWLEGEVCGLPEYRIASIGSRSNAEFSTTPFAMPDKPLLLNASIPEGEGLFDQAYVQVELRDETGKPIPGYERDQCVLQAIDDTRIPLRWGDRTGRELAGKKVTLRFCLRDARIYALGIER